MKPEADGDMAMVEVEIDGVLYRLHRGDSLQELADHHGQSITFGCFSGRCGFCKINVVDGAENLNSLTDLEEFFFINGRDSASERLACQCTPNGFVSISTRVD